jgi:hypothetical protein
MVRPRLPAHVFLLGTSIVLFALAGYSIAVGEVTLGGRSSPRVKVVKQQNPQKYWSGVGWQVAFATGLGAMGLFALSNKK